MIAIIDYGAGNLRSMVNAVQRLGYPARVTSRPADLPEAAAVILPGVGAAADAMANLQRLGFIEPLRGLIAAGQPFLGVCLGLQILFASTEEGRQECLGVLRGRVRRLPPGNKVPHMGWNQVKQKTAHAVFQGIPDGADFYFVHSYYAAPEEPALVAGETEYGLPFCSVAARGNMVATQFHPEKSGEVGLKFLDNFIRQAQNAVS